MLSIEKKKKRIKECTLRIIKFKMLFFEITNHNCTDTKDHGAR